MRRLPFLLPAVVAMLLFAPRSASCQKTLSLAVSPGSVGQYERVEFVIGVDAEYANPFNPHEVDLAVLLETPGGDQLQVPGFCCQQYRHRRMGEGRESRDWLYPDAPPAWKARFAASQVGSYRAVARLSDRDGTRQSEIVRFQCRPSDGKGFLQASPRDPRFLEFGEGEPFFAVGQNLAFIGSGQYVGLAKTEEIFANLAQNKANFLRIWTCSEDWALAVEARKSTWGRSWQRQWPIEPMPGADGAAGRKCVVLGGEPLAVSPCHPVALMPQTRYVLSGRVRGEQPGTLHIQRGRSSLESPVAVGQQNRWIDFRHTFAAGQEEHWFGRMTLRWEGGGRAWLDGLSLREEGGGPELLWEAEVNRPELGFYNPVDCWMLDRVVESAEKHGIYLQLCLLTRDLYMPSLKDPAAPAYDEAIEHAKNLLRYAVARWGYSTSVAAWEYFNELDPGLPSDRFYAELAAFLDRNDPYRHLRTTSTWGPSAKDCRHPGLDVAQVHYYLRPDEKRLRDEVEAALDRAGFLREHAPEKPVLVGEFGLATSNWGLSPGMKEDRQLVHFHNALWASALSGASGTVLFWWWDQLDRMDAYGHYRPLGEFLEDVPFGSGSLKSVAARTTGAELRVVGLGGPDAAYVWLFDPRAAWTSLAAGGAQPRSIDAAVLWIEGLEPGRYAVRWWHTREGNVIAEEEVRVAGGTLKLAVVPFEADVAGKIRRIAPGK